MSLVSFYCGKMLSRYSRMCLCNFTLCGTIHRNSLKSCLRAAQPEILLTVGQFMSYASLVPRAPTWTPFYNSNNKENIELSDELVNYLERTSLVEFSNEDSRRQLKEAIDFADQLMSVDTDGVEPLHSLNENEPAFLREDKVTEGDCREELLSLTVKSVEDWYYVAPPGNVPLDFSKKKR